MNYKIKNKTRTKKEKISTDKFYINRKHFRLTIKNTSIKHNPSTHFYDIGDEKYKNNINVIEITELNINNIPEEL